MSQVAGKIAMHPTITSTSLPEITPSTGRKRLRPIPAVALAITPAVVPDPKGIEPLYTHWVAG